MNRCRLPLLPAVLALAALLPWASATTVLPMDFNLQVKSADYVVRATVKSVTSAWRDNPDRPGRKYIGSLVELEVHEVIKGTPPSPLVLDLVGGRVGDRQLVIDGAPQLTVGQESFLFVSGNGRRIVPIVGLNQGHYPVRRDARTGAATVMRPDGRLLYAGEMNALAGPAAGAAPVRTPDARPLSVAEFSTLIRHTIREEITRERLH